MRSLIPSIFRSTSREHICAQVCRTPIMRPQIRRCSVAVGDEIRVVVCHLEVVDRYPGDALLVEILDDFQHPPVGTDDDLADEQLAGFGPPTAIDIERMFVGHLQDFGVPEFVSHRQGLQVVCRLAIEGRDLRLATMQNARFWASCSKPCVSTLEILS